MTSILWWLAQNTITLVVLISVVLVACRFLRRWPAVQHALWLIVLLKLLTPSIINWPWSAQDLLHAVAESRAAPSEGSVSGVGRTEPTGHAPAVAGQPAGDETVRPPRDRFLEDSPESSSTNWWAQAVLPAVFGVWLLGVSWTALAHARRVMQCRRVVARSRPAPGNLTREVEQLTAMLGTRALPTSVSDETTSPFVLCFGRLRLLWPASLCDCLAAFRGVIAHELAHVKRRDHWVAWLALIAGCVWWWNPLFWLVRRRLVETAEMACDAMALSVLPDGRKQYAEAFLHLSQASSQTATPVPALGAASVARRSFQRRFSMILSDHVNAKYPRFGLLAAFLLAVAALPAWSIGQDGPRAASPRSPNATAAAGRAKPKKELSGRIFVSAYFRSAEDKFSRAIIAIDPKTGEWQKMTGDGLNPKVSPDGDTLAFQRNDQIWMVDTQGGDSAGMIVDLHGRPIWSPDGKHLILSPWKSEVENEKKVMRFSTWKVSLDGSTKTRLDIPATEEVNDWSPDGKWLVAASARPPKARGWQLFIMRPDGTGARRLSEDGNNVYARFSPDSRRIAYSYQKAGKQSIRVVDVDGKNHRHVLRAQGLLGLNGVAWSPDGRHLAVGAFDWELNENGKKFRRAGNDYNFRLLIMEASGEDQRVLKPKVADGIKIIELGLPHWK